MPRTVIVDFVKVTDRSCRDRITTAATRLFEARQEWGGLPVGGSLSRAWA